MKIVDQTPFLSEGGKISALDQVKATLKYGANWLQEINAQKTVIACFGKVLDNSFTLLRNVKLASLDVIIPLILVGPAGIYVLYATSLRGMFRVKGDSWGTLAGYTFKPACINLIVRTAQMGRAVQTYLERQGYPGSLPVEAVLLASDPGLHIDSVRPIVRVVMRDALEHFAGSVVQGRTLFSAETVRDILDRITNPPATSPEQPIAQGVSAPPFAQETDAFDLDSTHDFAEGQIQARGNAHFPESDAFVKSLESLQPETIARRKKLSFSTKQWAFLIAFFVLEIIILVLFVVLIGSNL